MTFDPLGDLNWLAVALAALAYFVIGALWYAPPLFGRIWFAEGIALGLVVAIGFAVTITFVSAQFESNKPQPMVWGAVTAGYHVVGNLVAAIIVAIWR